MFVPYEVLPGWALILRIAMAAGFGLLFWRKLVRWHSRFEIDLQAHLGESSFTAPGEAQKNWQSNSERWQLNLREHVVGEQTRADGKAIQVLPVRQMFCTTVVGIDRQGHHLPNPNPETILYPNDKVLLLGTDTELAQADRWLGEADLERSEKNGYERRFAELCLEQLAVPASSRHIGKTLGELHLMQQLGIQVVGLERNGKGRMTPGKLDTLRAGDRLLVLGTQKQITDMAFWLAS
jgi:CPA2 family monovalent cation:H+ antiporter-2